MGIKDVFRREASDALEIAALLQEKGDELKQEGNKLARVYHRQAAKHEDMAHTFRELAKGDTK